MPILCHLHLHRGVGRRYAGGKGGESSRRHTSFFSLYRGGGRESGSSSAHKSKLSQSFNHSRFGPNCALPLWGFFTKGKRASALNQQASKDAERQILGVPNTHTALTRRAVNPSPGSQTKEIRFTGPTPQRFRSCGTTWAHTFSLGLRSRHRPGLPYAELPSPRRDLASL